MQLLVFQHSPDSPPGHLADEARLRGIDLRVLPAWNGTRIPSETASFAGLVLLGGPMNAFDDRRCPHFPGLLELAREFAASGRPVLGVCLGAQLLARAFGGEVRLGAAPEFGMASLRPTRHAARDPLTGGIAPPHLAFQWHDDTFAPPPGAVRLFTGTLCREQGFRLGAVVYAFQFHFEATEAVLGAWLELRARDADHAGEVARIRADLPARLPEAAAFGRALAGRWLDLVRLRAS